RPGDRASRRGHAAARSRAWPPAGPARCGRNGRPASGGASRGTVQSLARTAKDRRGCCERDHKALYGAIMTPPVPELPPPPSLNPASAEERRALGFFAVAAVAAVAWIAQPVSI